MLGCRCGCPALTGHRIIPPKPGTINSLPREDKKPVEHYGRKVFYSFGQASWPGPGAQKQLSRTQVCPQPLLQLLFVLLLLLFLQRQGPLTLLHQLDTTVGDKQDGQCGLREACGGGAMLGCCVCVE